MRKPGRTSKVRLDAGRREPNAGAAAPDPRLITIARALGRLLAREHTRADEGFTIADRRRRRP